MTRGGTRLTRLTWGRMSRWKLGLCIRLYSLYFSPYHFQIYMLVFMREWTLFILGPRGQTSSSTWAFCLQNLLATIQTTVLAQSSLNFTCYLLKKWDGNVITPLAKALKRIKVILPFVCGLVSGCVRPSVALCLVDTIHVLLFPSDQFQTSHVSGCWQEEKHLWFWVPRSKAKVNFDPLIFYMLPVINCFVILTNLKNIHSDVNITIKKLLRGNFIVMYKYKRKRKRSDSVLWQKPLHPHKNPKATWQHTNA